MPRVRPKRTGTTLAIFSFMRTSSGSKEGGYKRDVRRVYRNLTVAEMRIRTANQQTDPVALQIAKSA